MIMNFKFENDFENNVMRLHISLPLRKRVNERRVRIRWQDVDRLIKENYSVPASHALGPAITNIHHTRLDNDFENKCSGVWEFVLVPKKVDKPKKKAKRTRSRK